MNDFATIVTAIASFGVTALLGLWAVPFLRRIKYGQTIKEIGPTWHKNKNGTPTMGGLTFIIGILTAVIAGFIALRLSEASHPLDPLIRAGGLNTTRLFLGLTMALAFGAIGFADDYIKVVKKRNLGLRAREKTVAQILVAGAYLAGLYMAGDTSTILILPFLGQVDLGIFYIPFALFVIVGAVNAVNLTDGIDGLAASVTFVVGIGFMLCCALLSFGEMGLLATALAGGCLGFLIWNFHPAKMFMGDTGSMFLGGVVVALAFGIGQPAILILMGVVYIVETLSDIIQIGCYKLTHKRVFKMAPIHHHFEMSGWSEVKIVMVFSLVALAGCGLGIWSLFFQ
ncbi:phospho-N-acetylmuramoyl-pentapeptide-transferase [Harryflintia acetispora]|uniref:Phospho-N-acetylmuramoyl-pentapeptide-transferase n=1 Tax=Harryflintia acetispora TaxID=1849041 RepID=A0A9X8UKH8_9FIRM|nr:phospho-N-acetylmuramoyl-pentapeptide-transferase [Harryflintia acetispora]TCL43804.1 phospho-N-acetylmuramoyl-pentapeptide-transferase [Harryflintia acetispora]